MNTIEKEIYQAIQDSKGSVVNLKSELDITFKCASIVEKYAVGFSEWKVINEWDYYFIKCDGKNYLAWINKLDTSIKNKDTNELFQQYIQSLK